MRPRHLCAACVVSALLTGPLGAEEVTVQNDSFQSGGSATVVSGFVPGEEAAVRLTSPCDGTIVAVQVGWLDAVGGASGPSLESAIFIYDNAPNFPNPGTILLTLEAPVLQPGAINEFRYIDEDSTIPIDVPVSEGQQFYVSLQFANPNDVNKGQASVFRDTNGCMNGRNAIFAIPGGWINFCLFTTGDFVIRAVVECGIPDPQGACCFEATGGCLNLTQSQCTAASGLWSGAGTSCAENPCFPTGACCLPDGTCVDDVAPEDCATMGGIFQGDGSDCGSVTCPLPQGACCFSGGCLLLTAGDCGTAGGEWLGVGTDCTDGNGNGQADDCESGGAPCPGDADGSGEVDIGDLGILLGTFEDSVPPGTGADFDGDGVVGISDLGVLLANFNTICP